MREQDLTMHLQQQVKLAGETGTTLSIVGGNSKAFYGGDCLAAARLCTADHRGVIDYEPSELIITASSLVVILPPLGISRDVKSIHGIRLARAGKSHFSIQFQGRFIVTLRIYRKFSISALNKLRE